jgi:hypothetical protein
VLRYPCANTKHQDQLCPYIIVPVATRKLNARYQQSHSRCRITFPGLVYSISWRENSQREPGNQGWLVKMVSQRHVHGSCPATRVDKVKLSDFFLAVQRYFFLARVPPNRQLNRMQILKWRNTCSSSFCFRERAVQINWVNLVHVFDRKNQVQHVKHHCTDEEACRACQLPLHTT